MFSHYLETYCTIGQEIGLILAVKKHKRRTLESHKTLCLVVLARRVRLDFLSLVSGQDWRSLACLREWIPSQGAPLL